MSDQNQPQSFAESLSALMDNQVSELELQRILKASEQDVAVKATWARYQTASAVIRGERTAIALPDFAARVSAAIADEESYSEISASSQVAGKIAGSKSGTSEAKKGWFYQLGRVALVASVAGGMIVGVQQINQPGSPSVEVATAEVVPTANPVVSIPSGFNGPMINTRNVAVQTGYETRPQESRRVTFQPRQASSTISDEEVTRYVNQMIKAHSDNAAMNSGQGVLPYARVIMTEED
ncbi:MAG: mucA [Moraxellaceae bacterium]|nr:MAG: mucA [Moraxellaceae bacterium]